MGLRRCACAPFQAGFPSDPKRHFLVRELLERPGMTVAGAQGWQYVNPPETAEHDKPKDEMFVRGYRPKDNSFELLASLPGYQVRVSI